LAQKPSIPDFYVTSRGVAVPGSQGRMREGFDAAGFPSLPTRSAGREHVLPDGTRVRTMEPAGQAPRRASFDGPTGGPIDPVTGKPPQPPRGLSPRQRRDYVRDRTHLEQDP
jgi:filamentous hemagglutinin